MTQQKDDWVITVPIKKLRTCLRIYLIVAIGNNALDHMDDWLGKSIENVADNLTNGFIEGVLLSEIDSKFIKK